MILQAVRMGGQGGYKGVIFKYCPWCGENLTPSPTTVKGMESAHDTN